MEDEEERKSLLSNVDEDDETPVNSDPAEQQPAGLLSDQFEQKSDDSPDPRLFLKDDYAYEQAVATLQ